MATQHLSVNSGYGSTDAVTTSYQAMDDSVVTVRDAGEQAIELSDLSQETTTQDTAPRRSLCQRVNTCACIGITIGLGIGFTLVSWMATCTFSNHKYSWCPAYRP